MSKVNNSEMKVIRGYNEVRQALRDVETYSSDLQGDADVRDYRQIPLEVDPPIHHHYRTALGPYFVKPNIEKSVPEFKAHSEELIRDYFASSNKDAISNMVLPLVMRNLGTLYRRPQDVQDWISWGPDVWTAESEVRDGKVLHDYLDRIYQEALTNRVSDIWSEIARLEIQGKVIGEKEFRGIAGVMLAGGRDTVVKLFSGMLWHFANHPEELSRIRSNHDLIPNAIQEFLRFLTPLPQMARTTTPESVNKELPDDRYVGISFISANFDDSIFENPFVINLERDKNRHLSFGFGPHTCLGNHITEVEARVFLQTLLETNLDWEIESSEIVFHEHPYSVVPETFKNLVLGRKG
jgi:cytochrome P450